MVKVRRAGPATGRDCAVDRHSCRQTVNTGAGQLLCADPPNEFIFLYFWKNGGMFLEK